MSWLSLVFALIVGWWCYSWPCLYVYLSANLPLQNVCLAGSNNFIAAKFSRKMAPCALFRLLIEAEVTNRYDLDFLHKPYICSPEGTKRPSKWYIQSKEDTMALICMYKACALLCWHRYLVHRLWKTKFFFSFKPSKKVALYIRQNY